MLYITHSKALDWNIQVLHPGFSSCLPCCQAVGEWAKDVVDVKYKSGITRYDPLIYIYKGEFVFCSPLKWVEIRGLDWTQEASADRERRDRRAGSENKLLRKEEAEEEEEEEEEEETQEDKKKKKNKKQ